ncbi:MAG: AAA family ATPase [Eubacteriales bacterium]|nr:AAA family ATPase [Eubacteriales bacterium]
MEMTIKTMTIKDFKGIKSLTLDLDGHSASISGRNGTGKTSVCDAFLWLLFGKDSAGKTTDVKPLDESGERISGLESDVTAVLTVDGRDIELRRQLHEAWTKDPASGEKVYTRDETLCWIDGVPKKLVNEYTPFVLSLVGGDENTFKLISERGAFMRMDWNDRRKELVKIAGGDAEADIQSDPEFADIERVLQGATTEDAKKRLLDQRRRLEQELKAIPERIDELQLTVSIVGDRELSDAKAMCESLAKQQAEIDMQLAPSQENVQRMNSLYDQRRQYEDKVREIERTMLMPIKDALATAEGKLAAYQSTAAALHTEALDWENRLRRNTADLDSLKKRREGMLAEWHNLENMVYQPPEVETVCPTCGQNLPQDKLDEVAFKHRDEWLKKRDAKMNELKANGTSLKEQIAECQASVDAAQDAYTTARAKAEGQRSPVELEAEVKRLRATEPVFTENPEWAAATAKLQDTIRDIENQAKDSHRAELMEKRAAVEQEMTKYQTVLLQQETNERVNARIEELGVQKRDIGAQAAGVERDIELLSRYARARCTALETAINRRFHSIKWRMFKLAKNGSMIDCCDALVDGVAYSLEGHKLNSGACTNADIEIINVLSHAYGVNVPCFIDNAESVNQIGYPGGQRVLLRVTDDTALTITIEEE